MHYVKPIQNYQGESNAQIELPQISVEEEDDSSLFEEQPLVGQKPQESIYPLKQSSGTNIAQVYPTFGISPVLAMSQQPLYYQPMPIPTQQFPCFSQNFEYTQKQPEPKNYFTKEINNDLVFRTDAVGNINPTFFEFDDFFESHADKFLTPELDSLTVYWVASHILGLQAGFRDSWGKMVDKETYDGNLHLSRAVKKESCSASKLKFDYDDYITQIFVDTAECVRYIKIVTFKGKVLEAGKPMNLNLPNLVPELTRIIGFGGTINNCVTGLYFYYS